MGRNTPERFVEAGATGTALVHRKQTHKEADGENDSMLGRFDRPPAVLRPTPLNRRQPTNPLSSLQACCKKSRVNSCITAAAVGDAAFKQAPCGT